MDLSGLLKLRNVSEGTLGIFDTNLQNLSFLRNLEYVRNRNFDRFNSIYIHNNPKLQRLGIDSLEVLGPEFRVSVRLTDNHGDFCLTTNEIQLFAKYKAELNTTHSKICDDLYRKDGQKVCLFEELGTLNSNCRHVIGEVLIDSENEKEAWRLENMTNLYGSLTVEDTREMMDLGFLKQLEQVAVVKYDKLPKSPDSSNEEDSDYIYLYEPDHIDNRDFLLDKNLISFYLTIGTIMNKVYDTAAFINFFVNLPHLLILSQRELRSNLVYIIMIGICFSDLIHSIGKISQIFLTRKPIDIDCSSVFSYNQVIIGILSKCTQIMSRRSSGFLALFIAMFRSFSVCFPMSNAVNMLNKPVAGWLIVIGIMVICGAWSSMYYFKTIILEEIMCPAIENHRTVSYKQDTLGEKELILRLIDGYVALIVSFLYVLVAVALVAALVKAKERRKNLKSEKSSNTTTLVSLMAVLMFISETFYATIFILSSFFFVDFEERIYFEQLEFFAMTLSMINSIAHCIICFLMSSQYRDALKTLIWKENKKIDTTKTPAQPSTIMSREPLATSKTSQF
uniref:G_PROTEIN_RECEP_F1_2 domain-containing protein n=1 Tax=Caenorhabditis tropicalis TaxID=1561998 RepID=A0A1I7TSJ2_9PELO